MALWMAGMSIPLCELHSERRLDRLVPLSLPCIGRRAVLQRGAPTSGVGLVLVRFSTVVDTSSMPLRSYDER